MIVGFDKKTNFFLLGGGGFKFNCSMKWNVMYHVKWDEINNENRYRGFGRERERDSEKKIFRFRKLQKSRIFIFSYFPPTLDDHQVNSYRQT